jgi:hypothetical protein
MVICGIALTFHEFFIWETRPNPQLVPGRAKRRGKRPIIFAPFSQDRRNFAWPNVDNGKFEHISAVPRNAASLRSRGGDAAARDRRGIREEQ